MMKTFSRKRLQTSSAMDLGLASPSLPANGQQTRPWGALGARISPIGQKNNSEYLFVTPCKLQTLHRVAEQFGVPEPRIYDTIRVLRHQEGTRVTHGRPETKTILKGTGWDCKMDYLECMASASRTQRL
jgi:hypothetical protein